VLEYQNENRSNGKNPPAERGDATERRCACDNHSLGQVDLTGNFTLNHHYNFNNPSAFPFGTFGTLTVKDATGIFAPYVGAGDTLGVNTQFMFGSITAINSDVVADDLEHRWFHHQYTKGLGHRC
jgi:hypothetical protein